jgi:hypothetical protein
MSERVPAVVAAVSSIMILVYARDGADDDDESIANEAAGRWAADARRSPRRTW